MSDFMDSYLLLIKLMLPLFCAMVFWMYLRLIAWFLIQHRKLDVELKKIESTAKLEEVK